MSLSLARRFEPMSDAQREYLNAHLKALKAKTDPDLDEDIFFERFCAQQILKFKDMDVHEYPLGYTRGDHDGGADSIYFFCDGRLVRDGMLPKEFEKANIPLQLILIQATTSPGFDKDAIRKFEDLTNDLLDPKRDVDESKNVENYNHDVRTVIKRFRMWWKAFMANAQKPHLTIVFHFASKGDEPDPRVVDRSEQLKERVLQLYDCKCAFEFISAKQLLDKIRQERSDPLKLFYVKEIGSDALGDAYVCLVLLKAFVDFIATPDTHEKREYILDPNVRGYLGTKGVNEKIANTLKGSHKEDFWWLNNGVTIVAAKVNPKTASNCFELTRPRIVNGLQTSREIYNYAENNNWAIPDDPRHVLVRIIEAADKNLMNHVIKSTNSQTRIAQIYLHATEDVHFNIELAFPAFGIFYERVKNQWFDEEKPTGQIIPFPYLMKALMAIVLMEPDQARGRPDTFGEREYQRLFQDRYKPERYAKTALLMKRVDSFLESRLDKRDLNNLRYHVAMYVACVLCNASDHLGAKIEAIELDETNRIVSASDKLLKSCLDKVMSEYRKQIEARPEGQEHDNDPDTIAKGKELATNLKTEIMKEFPPHRRQRRARKVGQTHEA